MTSRNKEGLTILSVRDKSMQKALDRKRNPMLNKRWSPGNSWTVQGLGLCTTIVKGMGRIPGQGTNIPQATSHMAWLDLKKKKKTLKEKRWNPWWMNYDLWHAK